MDRTALVTPDNGRGVILIESRSREQIIFPSKPVRSLKRFHLIFHSIHQNVIIRKERRKLNEDFPQQGIVISWRSVQWEVHREVHLKQVTDLVADCCLKANLYVLWNCLIFFYSISKISIPDVEDRNYNGHNEEHCLKSTSHR